MLKNIPDKIYIQIGDDITEIAGEYDFNDLVGVSWCQNQIHKTDLEYVSKKEFYKKLSSKLENIKHGTTLTLDEYIAEVRKKVNGE